MSDAQDGDTVQCAMAVSTAKLATEPDTDTADDEAAGADVTADIDGVSDSWKMESLCPPPALFQPVKYPSLHIFVSYY